MTTDDDALLPAPPRATERYAATRPAPEWSPRADLCLAALTFASRGPLEYARGCALACRVLDREPTPAPKAKWTTVQWAAERVAQVEMRTVTRLISGNLPTVDALAMSLFTGRRVGRRLTWGEIHLLDCHGRKDATAPNKYKRPATVSAVLRLMDRPADDPAILWYMRGTPTAVDGPVPPADWQTAPLLEGFVATGKASSGTKPAWDALLDHLWGADR